MKKLFFAIGMMAMISAASAATAPAAGESQSPPPGGGDDYGCVVSPCAGATECKKEYRDTAKAVARLDELEAPCQGPPVPWRQTTYYQGPPRPAGGKR